uniref:KHP30-like phage protein n=1 Tax=Helicobacter pylori TaxID=210 RepID=A0A060PML3_HELPX|nr:KHP30-like phage protein [Helicobacter pylori]
MKQRVKTVSYLARAEFDIKNGSYDLAALPSGAEVVKCDLEVVGEVIAAKASVGFKDEEKVNFFLDDIDLTAGSYSTSAKCYTALDTKVISAKIVNASGNAKGVLRVLYFLPSETEVEY